MSASAPSLAHPPTPPPASNAPSIAQTAPPGFASITQPPQTATGFFKSAENQMIAIAWNLTSVLATPTSLTLSAVCDNGNTYPDIYSYNQANPGTKLAQASYTLHMWDDRGPTVTARGGWSCTGCSSALANRPALAGVLLALLLVLVSGVRVLRRAGV
ncbi:hypothetical protein B0H14DRAFT_3094733 [Mycena olivaceomarginata]|nr:hypothetical protein B0H14DRAFT_3094733 [Mycena olivaceomarginata]